MNLFDTRLMNKRNIHVYTYTYICIYIYLCVCALCIMNAIGNGFAIDTGSCNQQRYMYATFNHATY